MKLIQDDKRLKKYLEKENIEQYFNTKNLEFQLVSFTKGEYLSTPNQALTKFLFVIEGELHIFGIREDGTFFSVNNEGKGSLLGDMEFCKKVSNVYFTEAIKTTYCIALPIEPNRSILENDTVFLRFLLFHMANRLSFFSQIDLSSQTLEDKLLLYLNEIQSDHRIHKVGSIVSKLRCSRRQLQRVLHKLCEEGKLEKLNKGEYTLVISDRFVK